MSDVSRLADRLMPLNLFKCRIVRSYKKNNSRAFIFFTHFIRILLIQILIISYFDTS